MFGFVYDILYSYIEIVLLLAAYTTYQKFIGAGMSIRHGGGFTGELTGELVKFAKEDLREAAKFPKVLYQAYTFPEVIEKEKEK